MSFPFGTIVFCAHRVPHLSFRPNGERYATCDKIKLAFATSIDHHDYIFMYMLSVRSKKIASVIAKLFEHSCINRASIAEWIAGIVCALC